MKDKPVSGEGVPGLSDRDAQAGIRPVEPDLVGAWSKHGVYLFGLRTPFSLVFLSWMTAASALSAEFHWDRYLLGLVAAFFGLVVGAHYIDIAGSKGKYLPFFPEMNTRRIMLIGVAAALLGAALGVYIALAYNPLFLIFVALASFSAIFYPLEKPKILHTYAGFGLAWGFIPTLGAYYLQSFKIDLLSFGFAAFVGITVVQMHHMAVLSNEKENPPEVTKNARYLLSLHRTAALSLGLLLLLSKVI
jgi:MFS family permease